MSLEGRHVVVLAADLFEDTELLYPVLRLREEGAAVTLAGLTTDPVTGKKGHGPVEIDTLIADLEETDIDALVIPGGFAPDALRRAPSVLSLVEQIHRVGKPLAFICHAGWVPISAGILRNRRATSFIAIRDDMVNAGCDWADEPVVIDGNLISARHPGDLGPWMRALIAALATPVAADRDPRHA